MNIMFGRVTKATAVAILALAGSIAGSASAGSGFKSRVFASGAKIFHTTPKGREAISLPDDRVSLGGPTAVPHAMIFVP
jgi:hypothetical protein